MNGTAVGDDGSSPGPLTQPLRFADCLEPRPAPKGIDVETRLRHFAIITYALDPARLRPMIPERFDLDTVPIAGRERALLSVVPFLDHDFRSAAFWTPGLSFGQTNYRVYIRERETGRRSVWFLGTVLASPMVLIPRLLWRLPWHFGRMRFDCELRDGHYRRYALWTASSWAPAELELVSLPSPAGQNDGANAPDGFPDEETAGVLLTHPLVGYFRRMDGRLGSYRVWHDRLAMHAGRCLAARFGLLDRLGLVSFADQAAPHSVLLQPEVSFTIYLPPREVGEAVGASAPGR